MKLCKDCIHAIPVVTGFFGKKEYNDLTRCKKKISSVDFISGAHTFSYADDMREHGDCGPEGRLWEAKV